MGAAANPTITPQMLQRLQQMLSDPINGPKLMQILNNPNSGVVDNLTTVGNAVAKQQTPSGQVGAGIGTALGLGLKSLLNRKKPTADPMAGRDPSSPGYQSSADAAEGPPQLEPNQMDPSDQSDYTNQENPEEDRRGGVIGRKKKFRAGGEAMEEAAPPPKKRGILLKRPLLSTTIVISKKPPEKKAKAKAEKKARGGPIKPKKPNAIPPKSGPSPTNGSHNGWPPTPFAKGGHVQVPRGSGIAQRGKKFSGIF